ncbi:MAG: hypothetical protein [Olavius algarvensis Gamma 1 endosymbiont]|nr:MAG: hypothetical protein [Olavius algarvensis Gamma 1 endosymbiont]
MPCSSNQPKLKQRKILSILKILLIPYHWKKARTTKNCSTFQSVRIVHVEGRTLFFFVFFVDYTLLIPIFRFFIQPMSSKLLVSKERNSR